MAAMIVHSQNKTADAKKRYETIINADPTAAVAANNLAWIYAEEGQKLDEALRLAQGAASKLPGQRRGQRHHRLDLLQEGAAGAGRSGLRAERREGPR